MKRHASFPYRDDLEQMLGVVARLVEQDVAEPTAEHGAEDAVEKQVLDVAPGPAARRELRLARALIARKRKRPKPTR